MNDKYAKRTFAQFETGEAVTVNDTVPESARPFQGQRAGFVTRAVAALIDVGISIGAAAGLWLAVWVVVLTMWPSDRRPSPHIGPFVAFGAATLWVIWTVAWATTGRSVGASLMGIRVVNMHGRRLRVGVAMARAITCQVLPIGLLWVFASRANRSLQDEVFRTNVVYDWHTVVEVPADLRPVRTSLMHRR